jgi:hypothetical protein
MEDNLMQGTHEIGERVEVNGVSVALLEYLGPMWNGDEQWEARTLDGRRLRVLIPTK